MIDTDSYHATKERMVGNFQCDYCHIASMQGWTGTEYPREEECPTCCYGERMRPYRIYSSSAATPSEGSQSV